MKAKLLIIPVLLFLMVGIINAQPNKQATPQTTSQATPQATEAAKSLHKRSLVKEKSIWEELTKLAPSAVDKFKAATEALDNDDNQQAVKLYQEVLLLAPDFGPALRRQASAYNSLGNRALAIKLAEKAVQKDASPDNLISLALILYYIKDKPASLEDRKRGFNAALLAFEKYKGDDDPDYALLLSQMAASLGKKDELCQASQYLVNKHPQKAETFVFSSICAIFNRDLTKAKAELNRAESLGFSHKEAEHILALGTQDINNAQDNVAESDISSGTWSYTYYGLALVVTWALGLVSLFTFGKYLSNQTLHSIEQADVTKGVTSSEQRLRRFYKSLINIAGIYYYISLPILCLLVLTIGGILLYLLILLGRIPVKLLAIVVIFVISTLYAMISSFFIKIESKEPGRSLKYEEAPALWELTREVAATVGTRPVDDIRITFGTDMAVYEQGSFREKLQDKAKRNLILGVGLLNGFEQNAFRAVLAHEYGHFAHRDTAGGDMAMRVNADIIKFATAMAKHGQATSWNVAFQFLRVYHFIFRRISRGATRLQEVLADRIAALNYGAPAFEEGLRHVIRRGIEFEHLASQELERYISLAKAKGSQPDLEQLALPKLDETMPSQLALENLYQLKTNSTETIGKIEEEIKEVLNRATSEDDSHPCPTDRFRYVSKIALQKELALTNDPVWTLFADKEAIEQEMNLLIEQSLRR